MRVELPSGTLWHIQEAGKKLAHRARLPGARVFDLVARNLRAAKAIGMNAADRFVVALPASWLVNSPAPSRVLRRWALPPHDETCLALIDLLEGGRPVWASDPGTRGAIRAGVASLGEEEYVTEALSKVLALVVPDAVPLMPPPARAFVLGDAAKDDPDAFWRMVEWFADAVSVHRDELEAVARNHGEVELTGAGVLDRLLWFDSEGHAHFPEV